MAEESTPEPGSNRSYSSVNGGRTKEECEDMIRRSLRSMNYNYILSSSFVSSTSGTLNPNIFSGFRVLRLSLISRLFEKLELPVLFSRVILSISASLSSDGEILDGALGEIWMWDWG